MAYWTQQQLENLLQSVMPSRIDLVSYQAQADAHADDFLDDSATDTQLQEESLRWAVEHCHKAKDPAYIMQLEKAKEIKNRRGWAVNV